MKNPIGLFDSGIGGISILEKLKQLLPNENFIYLAAVSYTHLTLPTKA